MANEIKHTFTDSNIEINVKAPENYTGNGAEIAQYPWSNEMASGEMGHDDKQSIYGHLMNCMQINWGNAKAHSTISDNIVNSLIENGIKTSDELISIIYWMYYNLTTPLEQITCTLSAQPSTISAGETSTINVSFTNNNYDSSYLKNWGINNNYGSYNNGIYTSNEIFYSTVKKNESITINGTTSIGNNNNSTTLSISSSNLYAYTKQTQEVQISAEFDNKDNDKVNVNIIPATITINSIDPEVTVSYKWTIGGTEYANIDGIDTGTTCIIKSNGGNTTNENKTVQVQCVITYEYNNGQTNQLTKTITKNITVSGVPVEQPTYYWYVGQEIPTEISGTADYNNGGGWTSTGNSVPDNINQLVKGFNNTKEIFAAVPITSGTTLTPVATDMATTDTSVIKVSTKTLNGVNYQIYTYGNNSIRKTIIFVKK